MIRAKLNVHVYITIIRKMLCQSCPLGYCVLKIIVNVKFERVLICDIADFIRPPCCDTATFYDLIAQSVILF